MRKTRSPRHRRAEARLLFVACRMRSVRTPAARMCILFFEHGRGRLVCCCKPGSAQTRPARGAGVESFSRLCPHDIKIGFSLTALGRDFRKSWRQARRKRAIRTLARLVPPAARFPVRGFELSHVIAICFVAGAVIAQEELPAGNGLASSHAMRKHPLSLPSDIRLLRVLISGTSVSGSSSQHLRVLASAGIAAQSTGALSRVPPVQAPSQSRRRRRGSGPAVS